MYFCSNFALLSSCNVSGFDIASFVVEVVGVIATVAAVIVALVANKKATDSLKLSLKIQEQSKNVDLFEKRIAIINKLQDDKEISERTLMLLFNKKIHQEYKTLIEYAVDKSIAEQDMSVLKFALTISDGEGGYTSPFAELEDYERQLEEYDYPNNKVKEFEELCDDYQIVHSVSGKPKDAKVYNYREISNRIAENGAKFDEQKQKLLDSMQKFIQNSISPID